MAVVSVDRWPRAPLGQTAILALSVSALLSAACGVLVSPLSNITLLSACIPVQSACVCACELPIISSGTYNGCNTRFSCLRRPKTMKWLDVVTESMKVLSVVGEAAKLGRVKVPSSPVVKVSTRPLVGCLLLTCTQLVSDSPCPVSGCQLSAPPCTVPLRWRAGEGGGRLCCPPP